ncbi:hypothetical protein [Novosphingobium sp.]|uniref:hypothetical protein n=1 Tax=Novosphingobium sp. TaxID=1874826 RepID=UPI0035AFC367
MLGFGPKLNTVFQSRWKAVLWALGIMLTAYCTVPAADQVRQDSDQKAATAAAHHKSPWDKD